MITPQQINQLLASHGLRCTRQRQAIYAALHGSLEHPTAETLHQMVGPQLDGVSLATVYNTLEAFCDAGIARRLSGSSSGSARYDAACEPHVHLRCRETGRVSDAPDPLSRMFFQRLPADVLKRIESELGFDIDDIRVELVGRARA